MSEQQVVRPDGLALPLEVEAAVLLGRHRPHLFPARGHVVKVLYSEEERDTVERAAEVAGLRPSSYVATAALRLARRVLEARDDVVQDGATEVRQAVVSWSDREDRELLAELIQARWRCAGTGSTSTRPLLYSTAAGTRRCGSSRRSPAAIERWPGSTRPQQRSRAGWPKRQEPST